MASDRAFVENWPNHYPLPWGRVPGDYARPLAEAERAALEEVFSEGVCDWSRPGQDQAGLAGTFLSFGPAPSGRGTAEMTAPSLLR